MIQQMAVKTNNRREQRKVRVRLMKRQRTLYLMLIPGILWALLFAYGPMAGCIWHLSIISPPSAISGPISSGVNLWASGGSVIFSPARIS